MNLKKINYAILLLLVLCSMVYSLPAQEQNANYYEITVGNYAVKNLWLKDRNFLKPGTTDPWRYFMHGLTDEKATIIPWTNVIPEERVQKNWLTTEVKFETNVKTCSNLPVIKLDSEKTFVLPKPVIPLAAIDQLRGQRIRFFIWITGDNCGQGLSLWDGAPSATFTLKDGLGNIVATSRSLFKTRGTFPWFCYYVNVDIPFSVNTSTSGDGNNLDYDDNLSELLGDDSLKSEDDLPRPGGLYLTLKHAGKGNAYFTALSWECANADNTPSIDKFVDAKTGSRAPNPDYDELPMHLYYGLDSHNTWKFLEGNKNSQNITTVNGARTYIKNYADDWFHAQFSIAQLAYIHRIGTQLALATDFEDGWENEVINAIIALQDEETGLWKINGIPSIMTTDAMIRYNFSPEKPAKADKEATPTPWYASTNHTLNHKDEIISSLLNARIGRKGKQEYWNRFAFQPEHLVKPELENTIDLGTNPAAARILSNLSVGIDNSGLKTNIKNSINVAMTAACQMLLTDSGLWLQNSMDPTPSFGGNFYELLECSSFLEKSEWKNAEKPATTIRSNSKGDTTLTWEKHPANQVSLRLYAAPDNVKVRDIDEKYLIGIINRPNVPLTELDQICMASKIQQSAESRWGVNFQRAGADYLASKMNSLPKDLVVSYDGKKLTLTKSKNPAFKILRTATKEAQARLDAKAKAEEEAEELADDNTAADETDETDEDSEDSPESDEAKDSETAETEKEDDDPADPNAMPTSIKYYVAVTNAKGQMSQLLFIHESVAEE